VLLGAATPIEQETWRALEALVRADAEAVARRLSATPAEAGRVLDRLVERRLAVRWESPRVYYALTGLVGG